MAEALLIGNGPLSLPRYDANYLPAVVPVRCVCGTRFAVFTGAVDSGLELVKERAATNGQRFVDARVEPFLCCPCGQSLDFTVGESAEMVM